MTRLPPVLLACFLAASAAAQTLLPPTSPSPEPYPTPPVGDTPPLRLSATARPEGLPPAGDLEPEPDFALSPWRFFSGWGPPVELDGSLQLGINGSEGNSQTVSFRVGGELDRKAENHVAHVDFAYAKTQANSVETQNYAKLNVKYERLFGESPWTFFVKSYLYYDEFQSFDLRVVLNSGVGYRLLHTDLTTLTGRFGAGSSREIGGPDNRWAPEADFGADFERQLTKRQKLKLEADYYPDWSSFNDYRIVTNFAWEMLLDEEAHLSLKFDATDRYDSTPNGVKPNDINYSLLLLWKL